MGFAEFTKIIEKAEQGIINHPDVNKVKKKIENDDTPAVAKPPERIQAKVFKRRTRNTADEEDVVTPREPQIDIKIPDSLETIESEESNTISLFDYNSYDTNKFTAIDSTYSCIRFEQLKSELQDHKLLKYHKFDVFNYRIYYSREYIFNANVLLSKYKDFFSEDRCILSTSLGIPVLIIDNDTLVMCKDYEDDLNIEHILKVMLLEKYPDLARYQVISMDNYAENKISDSVEFDSELVDDILSNLVTIINANVTHEYLDNELCEHCIFKTTCQQHPGPLNFNLIQH